MDLILTQFLTESPFIAAMIGVGRAIENGATFDVRLVEPEVERRGAAPRTIVRGANCSDGLTHSAANASISKCCLQQMLQLQPVAASTLMGINIL